jgi:hypothetical protein
VREPTAADYAVEIGPIPTDRFLQVTERQASGKVYTLHIRDIQGRDLLRAERPLPHTLDIAELPEGMYILQIDDGSHIQERKFIIQR